jgi:NADPH:quinone reductase-like Zn-dependent oxidoreductase
MTLSGLRATGGSDVRAYRAWKLKPVVDKNFHFNDVQEALTLMEAGGYFGKICVTF